MMDSLNVNRVQCKKCGAVKDKSEYYNQSNGRIYAKCKACISDENKKRNRLKKERNQMKLGDEGYICNRCRTHHEGQPALKNNCGSFCDGCRSEILIKMQAGRRRTTRNQTDICIWCGRKIKEGDRDGTDNLHVKCGSNRDWLLMCIRYSDKPFRYITSKEEKEKPLRRQRELLNHPSEETQHDSGTDEKRIERLENMLEKLVSALGGIS